MATKATPEYHARDQQRSDLAVRLGQNANPGGRTVPPRHLEAPALLLDDGSVVVPAEVAGEVLRALARHVTERARVDGGQASPACRTLLSALYEAARRPLRPVAVDGNDEAGPATLDVAGMVTVAQLAEASGQSPRTLRHWAASGRVRAHRVGRTWLIAPDSLMKGRT